MVVMTYFRDQDMYDEFGRDEGPYGVANANARAAAAELERLGLEVEFRYPTEGAMRTPGSRYQAAILARSSSRRAGRRAFAHARDWTTIRDFGELPLESLRSRVP